MEINPNLNLLSDAYVKEFKKFNKDVKKFLDDGEKRLCFNEYSMKFTALPQFWSFWIKSEIGFKTTLNGKEVEFLNRLRWTALSYFFNEEFLRCFIFGTVSDRFPDKNRGYQKVFSCPYFRDDFFKNVFKSEEYLKLLKNYLTFPHPYLQAAFDLYKQYSNSFPSAEINIAFQKNLILYKKLKEALDDEHVVEWISLLIDAKDKELLFQNMEYYIAQKPFQKDAWNLYLFYLDLNDHNEYLLGVYSRYCRFFIDDSKMKAEYLTCLLKLQKPGSKSYVNWVIDLLDLISFNKLCEKELISRFGAKDMERYFQRLKILEKYQRNVKVIKCSSIWAIKRETLKCFSVWSIKREMQFFKTSNIVPNGNFATLKCNNQFAPIPYPQNQPRWNDNNLKRQIFPFCSTIIRQISEIPKIRQKLFETCKYFFAVTPFPSCHNLTINMNAVGMTILGNSIVMSNEFFNSQISAPNPIPLFVEFLNYIIVCSVLQISNSTNRNCFTHLIKLKSGMEIQYLTLMEQDLTLNDIILFIQKCPLISVKLFQVCIFNENSTFAAIEEVVHAFSAVKYLELNCETLLYTEETALKLSNLPDTTKFCRFAIYWATNLLNLTDFCFFLENHTSPNCHLFVEYHPDFKAYKLGYLTVVSEFLETNLHPVLIADH